MPKAAADRPTITRITLAVPPDLAADFKRACVARDVSMSQAMRAYMRDFVAYPVKSGATPGQLELDRAA
jgi:hypothetical protein